MLAQEQDLADGLEACVKANGDITATANLPMGGFLHTNVGAATARTQYGRVAEIQDGTILKAASPGGNIDAMTGTLTPAPSAYAAGMLISIIAPGSGSNTVTGPTINLNSLGAKTIKKHQAALAAGDYAAGDTLLLAYDGTFFELINPKNTPASVSLDLNTLTTDSTGGVAADFVAIVDASEGNASNKVLVTDFMTNAVGAMTTDTSIGATGDIIPFLDASASNSGDKGTVDNLFINALQLLTTDSTGGATADFLPFVDASDSNAGNKVLVSDFSYNIINNQTADTAPDHTADHVLTRDNSASGAKKVLLRYIGAGKQTIWIPAGAMTANTTNGPSTGTTESTTNKVMNKTLDFDTTTSESAQFTVAFPKGWNEGTVTFQSYWTAASGSGTFSCAVSGVALSDDDAIDTAFGTAQTVTDTLITALDVHVSSESSAITIAGTPAEGDIVYFKVARDVSDTLTTDAKLIGIKLFYTTDNCVDD